MLRFQFLFCSLLFLLVISSCNDSIFLGSDLLGEDEINVGFDDTLTIYSKTLKVDAIPVYNANSRLIEKFFIGTMIDPVFGKVETKAYFQYRLLTTKFPDFVDAKLDSLILSLVYDSIGSYGLYQQQCTFNVYQLTESMSAGKNYGSQDSFAVDPNLLGSTTVDLTGLKSVSYSEYPKIGVKDTIVSRQLRIKLSDDLGNALMSAPDSSFKTSENFQKLFKGLAISSPTLNGGLAAFLPTNGRSKLTLFYSKIDTTTTISQFDFGVTLLSARTLNIKHDYTGTVVENALNSTAISDSLVYLHGLSGTQIEIEVPSVKELAGKIVNYAELEFFLATIPNNDPSYSPIQNILISEKRSDGSFVIVDDVLFALNLGGLAGLNVKFGGVPKTKTVNGQTVTSYRMKLSAHLQKMIQGKASSKLYISVYLRPEVANRMILYGSGNIDLSPKLKVAFTKLQ